ncbi:redox-sensitive transcriptional activator SoxR [Lapillicoccus jejuensis]|uniref:MerR family redox-sensitive transcriptional activator SoxR n=1 Tax=Lapillicoccus jejuensis TaxID=402171 RepID=A0A542DVP4_9MICO|nr:redox-sensitive transcriptional activator SoxR [Lapillicoccus jejuensis]TQJ07172.1 MerR family redox-sensitive transcriptional activator SoxR [Lapillicoccus jejuensis]
MESHDLLPVGEVARRAGLTVPALRHYEAVGLVSATRTAGGQRRFPRHVLRRLAYVRAAQRVGFSLAEIREHLASLPEGRVPTRRDWGRLTASWRPALDARIEALVALRDATGQCIGCGCLSTTSCPAWNADDALAAQGPGARRWPSGLT